MSSWILPADFSVTCPASSSDQGQPVQWVAVAVVLAHDAAPIAGPVHHLRWMRTAVRNHRSSAEGETPTIGPP